MIGSLQPVFYLAFLAGLLSFLSPCTFPLIPAYAGFLAGRAGRPALAAAGGDGPSAPGSTPMRIPLLGHGIAFVAGFTAVFLTFFYILQALEVRFLARHQPMVNLIAGVLIVVLALQTLGLLRFGPLMRERKLHLSSTRRGVLPAFLLGVTFAAGYSPCISPQLAAILQVGVNGGWSGLPFLLVYCLGFAVPFLAVTLLADRLQGPLRAVNQRLGVINLVAGGLLLMVGLLIMTNRLTVLSHYAPQSAFNI